MEGLVSAFAAASCDGTKADCLRSFNEKNATVFEFASAEQYEEKRDLLSCFFDFIRDSDSVRAKIEALKSIRLLSREKCAIEPLYSPANLNTLLQTSKLQVSDFSTLSEEETEMGSEACKLFINLVVQKQNQEFYTELHSEYNLPYLCYSSLKNETLCSVFFFPITRLLLQLTARHENIKKEVLDQKLIPTMLRKIVNAASTYEEAGTRTILLEALSFLFVISQHLGPLDGPVDATEDELNAYKSGIPVLQKLLALPLDANFDIVNSVIKSMISVPGELTDTWKHEETLRDLLNFLVTYLRAHPTYDTMNAADLTPVLLILTSISKAMEESRIIIKDCIIPGWRDFKPLNNMVDPPAPMQEENSVGFALLDCMTSTSVGLYHYSAELMFSLCDEDADEFVRVVGVGKGAGILANRGLLNSFSAQINQPRPPTNITEEDVEEWNRMMDRWDKHQKSNNP